MVIQFYVRGGTSGITKYYFHNSSLKEIHSKAGEKMGRDYVTQYRVKEVCRHSFCVETLAANIVEKACAYCDVALPKLPAMELQSLNGFMALANEIIVLSIGTASLTLIRCLTVTVEWGDGSLNTKIENYRINDSFEHAYASPGHYEVHASLTGYPVNQIMFNRVVTVYPKIENLWCRPLNNEYNLKLGDDLEINVHVQASGFFNVEIVGNGLLMPSLLTKTCE